MHKHLLIFNPNSDRGRSGQRAADLRAMVETLGGADWRGTEYPDHASEIAAQAGGYDTVVALGGDGTVHEVVNGLMQISAEQRPKLGVVPIGSGNDFAYAAGVPLDNAQEAMRRALTGAARAVDIGLIQDGTGRSEYFDNTVGLGFDGAINIRSRAITYLYGFPMYLTAVIQSIILNFEAPRLKVQYDGGTLDQNIMMMTIGNGPREGGGFMTTPMSKLDDGIFDFLFIHQLSRLRLLQLLPKVMNATHVGEPDVTILQTTHLVIESDRALPIHIDGELFAPYEADVRHIEISMHPKAIQVVV
ncbi:MAG: diacylglycerol/lipid kinase family protein [Anaerolineales bacterium]